MQRKVVEGLSGCYREPQSHLASNSSSGSERSGETSSEEGESSQGKGSRGSGDARETQHSHSPKGNTGGTQFSSPHRRRGVKRKDGRRGFRILKLFCWGQNWKGEFPDSDTA